MGLRMRMGCTRGSACSANQRAPPSACLSSNSRNKEESAAHRNELPYLVGEEVLSPVKSWSFSNKSQ
uniref:Uncharacterized protein n=1 Tax=Knipowitschia caucasica TaxID=637954 RepID=A0AAV2KKM5_KNICA